MKLLLQFCFLFRALLVPIPKKLLAEIQRLFNTFVWDNENPRIKARILQQKTEAGSVALPNINLYYISALLEGLLQWWSPSTMLSGEIEQRGIVEPLAEWAMSIGFLHLLHLQI